MGNVLASENSDETIISQRRTRIVGASSSSVLSTYHVATGSHQPERRTIRRSRDRGRSTAAANVVIEGTRHVGRTNQRVPLYYQPPLKNALNLRKETLKFVCCEDNPEAFLVEFCFDASVPGSVTVYYFAKQINSVDYTCFEGKYEKYPNKTLFQPGSNQIYRQKPSKALYLKSHSREEIYYINGDRFPVVIVLESLKPSNVPSGGRGHSSCSRTPGVHTKENKIGAQITFATVVENPVNFPMLRTLKQLAVIEGNLYELQDIYGIQEYQSELQTSENDVCVICMQVRIDALLLPCRHLCICTECAGRLYYKSSKCPVCRETIQKIIQTRAVS
eukprot:jgi/Galph1/436/GphlegSOOS_G5260.1